MSENNNTPADKESLLKKFQMGGSENPVTEVVNQVQEKVEEVTNIVEEKAQ